MKELIQLIKDKKPFKTGRGNHSAIGYNYYLIDDETLVAITVNGVYMAFAYDQQTDDDKSPLSFTRFSDKSPTSIDLPKGFIIHSNRHHAPYSDNEKKFFLNGEQVKEIEFNKNKVRLKMNQSF